MFERFTDRARRVVVLAQQEARMLNHEYIGTEHILLGLIHEGEGVAAKALELLGISLGTVRQRVEDIVGRGQQEPSGHIPFTPRAKKVLELSLREALQLGHDYIGTEHILLGLLREADGVAAQVLVMLGADLNRVRQQVIQLLHRVTAAEGPSTVPAGLGAYERAAVLRDTEQQLQADKATRQREWTAAHPDLTSLAEKVQQLTDEVQRLRGLLHRHGIDTEDDAGTEDGTGAEDDTGAA